MIHAGLLQKYALDADSSLIASYLWHPFPVLCEDFVLLEFRRNGCVPINHNINKYIYSASHIS